MIDWQQLSKYKLLFITGKGGTGKTLFTSSLAIQLAQAGKKVLIVESTSLEQVPTVLGYEKTVGHQEVLVRPNISCINLNLRDSFREYVVDHLGMAKLYEKVFDRTIVRSFLEALPGLGEVMLLGRLYHTCSLRKTFDVVLFDAPATGHFTNLLCTLDAVLNSGLIGPLVSEVNRVKEFMADGSQCGVLFLALPEPLVINESLEFVELIRATVPVKLAGVFLNRIYFNLEERIETLRGAASSLPQHLQVFIMQRLIKIQTSYRELQTGLSDLKLGFDLELLPEMGVVRKNISYDFVTDYLEKAP